MISMIIALLVGVAVYYTTSLLGFVIHWAIHKPWAGKAYRAHRAHHVDLYPPGKLISDVYKDPGHRSTVFTFVLAFLPLLLLPVVLCLFDVITVLSAVAAVFAMVLVGLLDDIVHDSYHVRNHWLSKIIPGYNHMRQMHFVHHINMRKNFGIYNFLFDKIFHTHKKP